MPSTTDPDTVRKAVEDYLDEVYQAGQEPAWYTYEYYKIIAGRLSMGYKGLTGWQRNAAETRFNRQVLRSLHALTADGKLVKRGGGRDLAFVSPAEAARRDAEEADRVSAREQAEARDRAIRDRLRALGLAPGAGKARSLVSLSADGWETLLTLAEKGENAR